MAIIDDIKNKKGITVYPRTVIGAVYDEKTSVSLGQLLLLRSQTLGNVSNLSIKQEAGRALEIKWTDPVDRTITDNTGGVVEIAKWIGTKLVRKEGSYPADSKDGDLVVDSKAKDKYKTTAYRDEGLRDQTHYYYMLFPYTQDTETIDASNRVDAIAVNKQRQPAPPAPTISNLEFDRATVSGGDLVSLDKNTWHNSPHAFAGLTEETTYTAYAKKKETANYLESPISVGRTFKTPSDLPGPSDLIAGDMQAGYFGVVPASELFTGAEISSMTGISNGTLQFGDVGWLKFAIDGKIIYKSQKPYRHTISWDNINAKGCVDGTKQITKDGTTFRVRLMKGALTDPGNYPASDRGAKGSEWNRLMLPIHVEAKGKNWAYPAYVESNVPYWGIDFTDADLHTHNSHGDGTYHWCQEVRSDNASVRSLRGGLGVSYSSSATSSTANAAYGWSPILEVIQ